MRVGHGKEIGKDVLFSRLIGYRHSASDGNLLYLQYKLHIP